MGYIRFPIETSPDQLARDVFDFIQALAPNWQPNERELDVWIIRAVCAKAAENRDLASDVQDDIFRYFGAGLIGVPPLPGVAATGTTTWTMIDAVGHTIPANTSVAIRDATGQAFVFLTVSDYVVPGGASATTAGGVLVRALEAGDQYNGLGGAGIPIELIDSKDFVQTVVLTAATGGGANDETDSEYLPRLTRVLRRLSRRPIVAQDFADAALDVSAEVQRAVALDTYDPTPATYGHDRHVTIIAIKNDGTTVSAGTKTLLAAYYAANREVNFVTHIMDPNFTDIDAHADIEVTPGFDPATAVANVIAAIIDYLRPYNWGRDPKVTDASADETWVESDKLYYNEMITLVSNVEGVNRVADLTINKHTIAPARVDVNLTAPASLTRPWIANITATAI